MPRRQVTNEMAIAQLAIMMKNYDDAAPDVGMGYDYDHFIEQAAATLLLNKSDYERDDVLLKIRKSK